MGIRTKKKLTRFTETGRAESEIESIFLSKGEADENFQKVKTLRTRPTVDDLNDGEMAQVVVDEQIDLYIRRGRSLYKLTGTKIE